MEENNRCPVKARHRGNTCKYTQSEQHPHGELLARRQSQIPDEHSRQEVDGKILQHRNDSRGHDVRALVKASEFVRGKPGCVVAVPEAGKWGACEQERS